MAITFPPTDQSPWTNPETNVIYEWQDDPGAWVPLDGSAGGDNIGGDSGGGVGGNFAIKALLKYFPPHGLTTHISPACNGDKFVVAGAIQRPQPKANVSSSTAPDDEYWRLTIAISEDGGTTWEHIDFNDQHAEILSFASLVIAKNNKYYLMGRLLNATQTRLFESEDGRTWTALPNPPKMTKSNSVFYEINGVLYYEDDGYHYKSEDYGRNWVTGQARNAGLRPQKEMYKFVDDSGNAIVTGIHVVNNNRIMRAAYCDASTGNVTWAQVGGFAPKSGFYVTKSGRILGSPDGKNVWRTKSENFSLEQLVTTGVQSADCEWVLRSPGTFVSGAIPYLDAIGEVTVGNDQVLLASWLAHGSYGGASSCSKHLTASSDGGKTWHFVTQESMHIGPVDNSASGIDLHVPMRLNDSRTYPVFTSFKARHLPATSSSYASRMGFWGDWHIHPSDIKKLK